ncbi:MAG TPA: cysteine desulfurase [Chitinophagaceae bacterium]|nr:cysteine desulfurase [Bacteroidota bacterium]HBB58506.1 cysteine desulfurase [Chitinophagaceae bacterium]
MSRIYLDNAATTPLDPQVMEAMLPYLTTHFGNPSSIYSFGRETRLAVENARKTVARIVKASPGEIFFTSGGTESDNMAIMAAVEDLGCRHIITSSIEHHAVVHTIEHLQKKLNVQVSFVSVKPNGHIDLDQLASLVAGSSQRVLVSLMHANNEIGNLLDIERVGAICKEHGAIFHSDTVQTLGHYPLDFSKKWIHFATGASHKFHGPKGVGVLYVSDELTVQPIIHGGGQERNMRAGTENIYGIVGFAKALELADQQLEKDRAHILSLKLYMAEALQQQVPELLFNGDWNGESLYTVLNVSFPRNEKTEMLLMALDMQGICVSGGSACSSGADVGSHVIRALRSTPSVPIRFSFSKYNTKEQIDEVLRVLAGLLN